MMEGVLQVSLRDLEHLPKYYKLLPAGQRCKADAGFLFILRPDGSGVIYMPAPIYILS
jgi:hypothetical protein